MCKHLKFDANKWAPCKVCMTEKRVASTVKNQKGLLKMIAELTQEADVIEAKGRKARFERAEIATYESLLKEAGLM